MLDPRRLLTFREVARHGSFSRAAETLALTQPAVSQQVSALERELGTALLVRGRGGAVPTVAGELLLAHADALAARLELADSQMAALVEGERSELRVGAFPTAVATIVPTALAALRSREPRLEVAVEEDRLAELVRGVQSGRLHAAVCFQDAAAERREHDGLERHDLLDEPMLALLPADHRLAGRDEVALRSLRGEPWLAPSGDGLVVAACRAAGFEPRLAFVARDPLANRAIVAAGLAVSITPSLVARMELPGIATPRIRGKGPRRTIYALVPAEGRHPLAPALLEELAAAAAG
jgi:DNA-binding transcriptional LysR family regulator